MTAMPKPQPRTVSWTSMQDGDQADYELLTPLFWKAIDNRVVVGKLGCRRLGLNEAFSGLYDARMVDEGRENMLDVTKALDVPIFISQPHFWTSDVELQSVWVDKYTGLEVGDGGDEEVVGEGYKKHLSYIDVHMQTGKAVSEPRSSVARELRPSAERSGKGGFRGSPPTQIK